MHTSAVPFPCTSYRSRCGAGINGSKDGINGGNAAVNRCDTAVKARTPRLMVVQDAWY